MGGGGGGVGGGMGALIFIAKVTTDYYWNDKIILQCTY